METDRRMKAAVYSRYGPPEVLHIEDVEKPIPGDNEVLIKIRAASVTPADWRFRKAEPVIIRLMNGLMKPKVRVLGMELSGDIVAVGEKVTSFAVGDAVLADTASDGHGAHADYKVLPQDGKVAAKPAGTSYEEAAAGVCFGGLTALHFLRDKGQVQSGQKVLINGASGGCGTFAVQVARSMGAEVTGVCSTRNLELVTSLGADHVIDYTQQDFTKNGIQYDVIFDTVGKVTFSRCKGSLRKDGRFLALVFGLRLVAQTVWTSVFGSKKAIASVAMGTREDLEFLTEMVETGKLKPIIDRSYPLEQIAEAHRYVENGHKRGSVVVTPKHD